MTLPPHRYREPRRCTCCGEMRTPPVCHPCDALLPPADLHPAVERAYQQGRRDAFQAAAGSFRFMGLDPEQLTDAVYFARARGWRAPSARQQPGSTPTDTTRE